MSKVAPKPTLVLCLRDRPAPLTRPHAEQIARSRGDTLPPIHLPVHISYLHPPV